MAALTGLLAVLSLVYQQPIFGLSAWSLADASRFVVIGWRISKMSRAWAVIGIALYVLEAVSSLANRAGGIGVLTIVFILVYINALRGTFAYRRYTEELQGTSEGQGSVNTSSS
jgi:cytochrome bd-type quinol oxidase subunit 1